MRPVLKEKRVKKSRSGKQQCEPKPLVFNYTNIPLNRNKTIVELKPLEDSVFTIFLSFLSKAETWRQIKPYIMELRKRYLTFLQISDVIHRIPTIEDRIKAAEALKCSVRDNESSFFLFIQSFATLKEREAYCKIFNRPLPA